MQHKKNILPISVLILAIIAIVASYYYSRSHMQKQFPASIQKKIPVEASPDLASEVGQMMMVGFKGTTVSENSPIVQEIKNFHVGSVIIYNRVPERGNKFFGNVQNPKQLKDLITALQFYSMKYNHYPLLVAVNQEGGLIDTLIKSKGFALGPNLSQAQLGKNKNIQAVYQEALQRGTLLKNFGINLNLAPVADLNKNPNSPGIAKLQRSFGLDAAGVIQNLQPTINAYKKSGILCAMKHFPGFGSAAFNTDYARVDVSHSWGPNELLPYQRLIAQSSICPLVMITHLINRQLDPSGLPATFSKAIVTDLLVGKMHYSGVIITDDMDAAAIRKYFSNEYAIDKAVLAGNDIIIYGGSQGQNPDEDTKMLFSTLMKLAKENPVIRKRVAESCQKIIRLKRHLLM